MPATAIARRDRETAQLQNLIRTEGPNAANVIRAEQRFQRQRQEAATWKDRAAEVYDDARKKLREWSNERSMRVAGAAVGGAALGATVAYFGDGMVLARLGPGTFGLILIPGVGLVVAGLATQIKDRGNKSMAETRAGVFGFGLALTLMGGYMSYRRWA